MRMLIQCEIKPDQVERNLELLRAAFGELAEVQPEGVRYSTFQLDDKVTFVSFVEMSGGPAVMHNLPAFQRYRSTLDERCVQPPVITMLHDVGSYRFC